MKILKKTNGRELLKLGWVIKLQPPKGNTTIMVLYKVVRIGESSVFCVPFSPIAKRVFDNREQEINYYSHMDSVINISIASEVEVYGTHRNNLDNGKFINK